MMNMKKLLALLLAAVMVLGMFPMGALADETEPELCTCGLALNHDGECQSQEPTPQNLEEPELCICGLEKGHEGECKTAEPEYCDCGLAKGHEGECKTAEPEYCDCGLTKGHEGECQKTEPEYCDCGLAKGHEGECKTAEPEYCDCGLAKGHEGDCKKAEPEKCALCESTEHATNLCTLFCGFCQKVPCECVVCEKCGVKNGHTSECENAPAKEETFAEKLQTIDNLSDLLIEICKEENLDALLALTAEEITALRTRVEKLFAALTEPTEQDEWDRDDLLSTLEVLPNAPEEIIEIPELVPGDYDSIMAHMSALEEEVKTLSTYEDCKSLYQKLDTICNSVYVSDVLMFTDAQWDTYSNQFRVIMDYMEENFGFTGVQERAAVYKTVGNSAFTVPRSSGSGSNVLYNKTVSEVKANEEYLLTLDAFVRGTSEILTRTKPADIVLVLDQSASMYAPMGGMSGQNHTDYSTTIGPGNENYAVTQYSGNDLKGMLYGSDTIQKVDGLLEKASQLGYFVAQSNTGGQKYCTVPGHWNDATHTKGKDDDFKEATGENNKHYCHTKDWFVVQYVENDPKGYQWHLYRISKTANPSKDSLIHLNKTGTTEVTVNKNKLTIGTFEISHEADIVKYKTIDAMINESGTHFDFYKSQYGALYDAISGFGKGIVEADVGHRLAVVGFSGEAYYDLYRDGSELYINGNSTKFNSKRYNDKTEMNAAFDSNVQKIYSSSTISNNTYKNALMSAGKANETNIMNSINAVKSDYYGTNHDVGIYMANKIFEQNPIAADEARDRFIIMFTDGEPSPAASAYNTGYDSLDEGLKEQTVKLTYTAKNTYNAQVYTIWTRTLTEEHTDYMRYASSNYPNATSYSNPGELAATNYASGTTSAEDLLNAFDSVFEDISSATITTLTENTVIRDIVAPSFTLPIPAEYAENWDDMTEEEQLEELKSQIQVYKAEYRGNNNFAQSGEAGYTLLSDAVIDITKNDDDLYQIDVKNFDFSANYVADLPNSNPQYRGAKLIVTVPIVVKPDFLGGNNVVTNGEESGVYASDGTPVGIFDVPAVNIPVKNIIPASAPGKIYLSQKAEIPHIANIGWFRYDSNGDGKIDDSDVLKQTDGINNAYVNITYTIADKSFTGMAEDYSNVLQYTLVAGTDCTGTTGGTNGWTGRLPQNPTLTDDATYYLRASITPTTQPTGGVTGTKKYAQQTISVYKPEVTFQDSKINLGETANYATQNLLTVVWKHGDTEADTITMGPAPILAYTYVPEQSDFKSDTAVQVTSITAGYGDQTVNDYKHIVDSTLPLLDHVKFYRMPCTFNDCDMHGKTENQPVVTEDVDTWVNFIVHLNTFDLIISKTGTQLIDNDGDEAQSYLFRITRDDGFSLDVTIVGDGSTTIKGLLRGDYDVTELSDWSWRYETVDSEGNIVSNVVTFDSSAENVVSNDGTYTASFTNGRKNPYWLSGDSYCRNWWKSATEVKQSFNPVASN